MSLKRPLVKRLALGGILLTCIAACNFIIDVDPAQCETDADCKARFSQLNVCQNGMCVEALFECRKNAECIDKEAVTTGRPAICVDQHCQAIVGNGELCLPQLLPTRVGGSNAKTANDLLREDDVIVIGALTSLNEASPLQQPNLRAYNLALKEIAEYGGVPIGSDGKRRPLVMAVCRGEQGSADTSTEHLITDLHVPVIVPSVEVTDLASIFKKMETAGVFGMNPSETLDKYAAFGGFMWSLLGSPEDPAQAYAPATKAIETHLRAKRKLATDARVKLAVIATTYAVDQVMADAIEFGPSNPPGAAQQRDVNKATVLNGQPLSATANEPSFRHIRWDLEAGTNGQSQVVDELAGFCPDIIVALTGDELGGIVKTVEEKIAIQCTGGADAGVPGAESLPIWLLGTRNARPASLFEYLNTDVPELRATKYHRFFGVQYAGSSEVVAEGARTQREAWLDRMKENYGGTVDHYADMENFYDAIYWVAYGLSAYGVAPVPATGTSLKDGVRRLLEGPSIFPGHIDEIGKSFLAIQNQRLVNKGTTYVGALGPRDIDVSVGRVFGTGALYCYLNAGAAVANPISIKYDVRRYLEEKDGAKLVGDDACFVGMPF